MKFKGDSKVLVFTDLSGGTKQQRTTLSESAIRKLSNFAFYPKTVAKLVSQTLFSLDNIESAFKYNSIRYVPLRRGFFLKICREPLFQSAEI